MAVEVGVFSLGALDARRGDWRWWRPPVRQPSRDVLAEVTGVAFASDYTARQSSGRTETQCDERAERPPRGFDSRACLCALGPEIAAIHAWRQAYRSRRLRGIPGVRHGSERRRATRANSESDSRCAVGPAVPRPGLVVHPARFDCRRSRSVCALLLLRSRSVSAPLSVRSALGDPPLEVRSDADRWRRRRGCCPAALHPRSSCARRERLRSPPMQPAKVVRTSARVPRV